MGDRVAGLEASVERLARELRWTRRALAGVAACALAWAGAGVQQASPAAGEVRATRFVLVGAKDKALATLEPTDDGMARLVLAGHGKAGVALSTEAGSPRLALTDTQGRDRLWVALRLGSPTLQFLNTRGLALSGLAPFNDEGGVAVISEADGAQPGLVLYGKKRNVVWSAP